MYIYAKKDLNALNKIKKAEIIKYKKCTPGHKKLLNLFNDLSDKVLICKTLENQESKKEEKEVYENKDEIEDCENEDDD